MSNSDFAELGVMILGLAVLIIATWVIIVEASIRTNAKIDGISKELRVLVSRMPSKPSTKDNPDKIKDAHSDESDERS
jgi:uncharacterized membrane protein YfhO